MTRKSETVSANGSDFNVPFFQVVSNGKNQSFGYDYSTSGINSLFGSAELSYKVIFTLPLQEGTIGSQY